MRRIGGIPMKVGREDKGCLEMYIRLRRMASMIMVGSCDETLLYVCSLLLCIGSIAKKTE
jgi:hypothetical protein